MSLTAGTRLGPYEIQASIGSGGMGQVYRAQDTRLNRLVAIKILSADFTKSVPVLERFEREARAIASLNHPNICTIHDVGKQNETDFLVMELLEGESLHQLLSRGALPLAQVIDWGIALADALSAAHQKGILHRDIKPANIFITSHGPKILDFGLAKGTLDHAMEARSDAPTGPGADGLTDPGHTVGTLAYMSPEQLQGETLDARTDLFSLGIVLYQMATGQTPFTGPTSAVVAAAILHKDPVAPRQLRPELPERLEEAILKTLEKDRDQRSQTAAELRADFRRLKRNLDSSPRHGLESSPSGEISGTKIAPPPESSSDVQIATALARRHRSGLMATVLLTLLALGGGIYGLTRWRTTEADKNGRDAAPSNSSLQIEAVTKSGNAHFPGISPDGQYVVYAQKSGNESSLWIRQIATPNPVPIVPPEAGVTLIGGTVTPDGRFVDFVKSTPAKEELWRIPFLGGVPRKLIDNIRSLPGWSPDGQKIAFLRAVVGGVELVITDSNGSQERVLATRISDTGRRFINLRTLGANIRIPIAPAWSPNGKIIAAAAFINEAGADHGQLVFVDASTGKERTVKVEPSAGISALAWLDDTSLVLNRMERIGAPLQMWRLSYPDGGLARITNDLSFYMGLSLSADRRAAVTSRNEWTVSIWTGDGAGTNWKEVVPQEESAPAQWRLAWSGEALLYPRAASGRISIWRFAPGKDATPEEILPSVFKPMVAGQTLVLQDIAGSIQKADLDGGNRTALPIGTNSGALALIGRDAVFAQNGMLHLAPLDGGPVHDVSTDLKLIGPLSENIGGSPDGKLIVFPTPDAQDRPTSVVCDLATCKIRKVLPMLFMPRWLPDASGIAYIDKETKSNLWIQPLDGKPPHQLTHFTDGRVIVDFNWSADGKRLAMGRSRNVNDIVLFRGLQK